MFGNNLTETRALSTINKADFPADEFTSLDEFSSYLSCVGVNIVFKTKKFNNPLEIFTKALVDYRKTQLYDFFMEESKEIDMEDTQLCIIFPGVHNRLFALTNMNKVHFYNRTFINLNNELSIILFEDLVEIIREMVT